MKISQLVDRLNELWVHCGDVDVTFVDTESYLSEDGYLPIMSVEVEAKRDQPLVVRIR